MKRPSFLRKWDDGFRLPKAKPQSLLPLSVTNTSVHSRTAAASHVGHNSNAHVVRSGRSRTDAACCNWMEASISPPPSKLFCLWVTSLKCPQHFQLAFLFIFPFLFNSLGGLSYCQLFSCWKFQFAFDIKEMQKKKFCRRIRQGYKNICGWHWEYYTGVYNHLFSIGAKRWHWERLTS